MSSEEEVKKIEDKRFGKALKSYQGIIAAVFVTIVLGLIVFFFFSHFKGFFAQIGLVLQALQAVVIGVVIGYVVCPVMNGIEKKIRPFLEKHIRKKERAFRVARSVSIGVTLLLFVAIIGLLARIIVPQVVGSATTFFVTLPENIERLTLWLQGLSDAENEVATYALSILNQLLEYIEKYFDETFNGQMTETIKSITTGVINVGRFVFNLIIGLIVAIYVLFDKEKFLSQAKKLVCTIFQPHAANVILETTRETHEIFIGFIVGKIIDSIVIGLLTYIVLICFSMPYAILVSVIVGVTNIIPFFGPFIGAIPSFLLILLEDPIKGLIFILIILVIQQVDGNIIGPKILGESTGLSTFWVIVAILFSGGLFGFVGMLLGVPLFATISNILKKIMNYWLRKKNLPVETAEYEELQYINTETGELCYEKQDRNRPHAWQFWKLRKYNKTTDAENNQKYEE